MHDYFPSDISEWRLSCSNTISSDLQRSITSAAGLAPKSRATWNGWKSTVTLGPPCFAGCHFCFILPSSRRRKAVPIASATAFVEEFVSLWLSQHGAEAKTAASLRKHRIFNESTVLQMLRLACEGHAMRNRHRRPFPLESAVPGFAEYLRCEHGFKEITIYAYRRHLNELAEYLSQPASLRSVSCLRPSWRLSSSIVRREWLPAPVVISVIICGCCCSSATVRVSFC